MTVNKGITLAMRQRRMSMLFRMLANGKWPRAVQDHVANTPRSVERAGDRQVSIRKACRDGAEYVISLQVSV